MLGNEWRSFKVCNIQNLAQANKPQNFSFRLMYEEFISSKLYKHYLFLFAKFNIHPVCLTLYVYNIRDVRDKYRSYL